MSTRGAWGFRIGGKDKIAFNHWDSYPECFGKEVIEFIKEAKPPRLAEIAGNLLLVAEEDIPTKQQLSLIKKSFPGTINLKEYKNSDKQWYNLKSDSHDFDIYLKEYPFLVDCHNFLKDSLFCEHAYIINIDEGILEYYKGFNRNSKAPGRYAKLRSDSEFYGVALLTTYKLADLLGIPTEEVIADMLDKAALLEAIQSV